MSLRPALRTFAAAACLSSCLSWAACNGAPADPGATDDQGEGGADQTPAAKGGTGGRSPGHDASAAGGSTSADAAAPVTDTSAPDPSDTAAGDPDGAATISDAADARLIEDGASPADTASPADASPPPAYDPCPPKGKGCVALPLGDSLTQGAGSSGGGYRRELFRQVVSHGQSVTFVGSAASGPTMLDGVPRPFPRSHEGHGGFTIQNIATWITEHDTITTYKPDIVMLQIGTNNGLRHAGANVPAALTALGALIDQILAQDAHLLLIVAQITPTSTDVGLAQIQAYNKGIPALVAARAAAGKHIALVDIYKAFVANPNWKTAYLPGSDVHPVDAGYDAMGLGWYGALRSLLH